MPTRHMVSMIAVFIAVTYAAVSQGNGPAYLPAYALFSLLLVSWLHNRANVKQLEVTTHREAQGFAGAVLLVPFKLRNKRARLKFGLVLTTPIGGSAQVGRVAEQTIEGAISISGLKRGVYPISRIGVESIFPLGVFRSRTRHPISCLCHIYPEPLGEMPLPTGSGAGKPENQGAKTSGDDFAGVRNYLIGESQRHVDWKAVARGQPMMIKQFESPAQQEIWLDLAAVKGPNLEGQLSQMARWIMQCERAGLRYGLRVGGGRIPPGHGNTHYHHCLRELAGIPKATESSAK